MGPRDSPKHQPKRMNGARAYPATSSSVRNIHTLRYRKLLDSFDNDRSVERGLHMPPLSNTLSLHFLISPWHGSWKYNHIVSCNNAYTNQYAHHIIIIVISYELGPSPIILIKMVLNFVLLDYKFWCILKIFNH